MQVIVTLAIYTVFLLPVGSSGERRDGVLQLAPGQAGKVSFLEQGDFYTLKPSGKLSAWTGGAIRTDEQSSESVLEAVKGNVTAQDHHVRYGRVIRVEVGYTYTLHLEYRTDMEGVRLELHNYAFSTFGDTVGVVHRPLMPSPDSMRKLTCSFTPTPGAISLFPRVAIPKNATGALQLRRFNISGYPWAGQTYPEIGEQCYRDRNWWEIVDRVENSVRVNTLYFGPNAQNEFPIRRGRGTGRVWIPAGALVPFEKGEYTVAIELRELGGGRPLARYAGTIANRAASAPSQRVLLPDATKSCTIAFASWDSRGGLARSGTLRLYVQSKQPFVDPPDWTALPARRAPWPRAGQIGISMNVTTVSNFQAGKPTEGSIDVRRAERGRTLVVRAQGYERRPVFRKEYAIPAGRGTERVDFSFTAPQHDVYEVQAKLFESGRLLDLRELAIGLRHPSPATTFVRPALPDLCLTQEQAFRSRRFAPAAHEQLERHIEYVKKYGNNTVGIGCLPMELNPLPGMYRFAELEERVRLVSEAGLKSHIYVVTYMKYWPDWAIREMGLDQDGKPDELLSIASPGFRKLVASACRELARHFRSNPDVVSYGMWGAWCEWSYRDTETRHYDYSPSSLVLWNEFAGGIEAPRPLKRGPDLRPEWQRWAAFRTQVLRKWFVEAFGETIRKEDPERWLVRYFMAGGHGAMEELYADFKRLGIYPAHGGSDPSDFRRHGVLARQYGLLYLHEFVSAPARHPLQYDLVFFHGLFNGLPKGVPPAYNVAWNIGWNHTHSLPGVLRAQERRQLLLELVRWMHRNGYQSAENQWAQYHSWDDTVLGGARNFQWYGLSAGLYWADMFEHISYDGVSDRTPLELWRKYKCILSYRPRIITEQTAEKIRTYVRDGGTFGLVLYPGPGMAVFTGRADRPAQRKRVAATGRTPHFSKGRRLVLLGCCAFEAPAGGVPIAASDEDRVPVAWDLSLGKGHLLLFAGKPVMPESRGFLEDILRHLGVRRQFELISEEENDYYPPEALKFVDNKDGALLLIMRGTRWNNWRQLKAKAGNAEPTFDGLAEVFPRRDVQVTYYPASPGTYQVARWHDGQWTAVGTFAGEKLTGPDLKVHVAPAELGVLRFLRVPGASSRRMDR